jgi:hypothetical protein
MSKEREALQKIAKLESTITNIIKAKDIALEALQSESEWISVEEAENLAIHFLDTIRDYELENKELICHDERSSRQLFDLAKSEGLFQSIQPKSESEWISVYDNPYPEFDGKYQCYISQIQSCGNIWEYQKVVENSMTKWVGLEPTEQVTHYRKLFDTPKFRPSPMQMIDGSLLSDMPLPQAPSIKTPKI